MTKKSPSMSSITMRELVMPNHANPIGSVFGGVIMSWVDIAASMCATRHCGTHVVTAQIDSISFLAPVHVGNHVCIKASVNFAGKTSMEVGVKVFSEDPLTQVKTVTTRAYLTMVSIDENGKPLVVPKIDPESDEQKRRFLNAKVRVQARKALKDSLK